MIWPLLLFIFSKCSILHFCSIIFSPGLLTEDQNDRKIFFYFLYKEKYKKREDLSVERNIDTAMDPETPYIKKNSDKKSSGRKSSDKRNNNDPLFVGGHYLPVTMRNAPRSELPLKPEGWAAACQSQAAPIWNLKTASYFPFSIVSSSYQGSIRQGRVLEAIQWCMEMMKTDSNWAEVTRLDPVSGKTISRKPGKGEANLWTRAFIICAEDIALANPAMIILAAQLLDVEYNTFDEAETSAINMTVLLARSMKSRATDYACICRRIVPERFEFSTPEQVEASLEIFFNRIVETLLSGDHVNCIGYVEQLIVQSLHDKDNKDGKNKEKDPLSKVLFERLGRGITMRGKSLKHYKNKRQLIWLAFFKALANPELVRFENVRKIVEACYDVAHDSKFRWGIPSRLFGRMAVMAICLRDAVEARGLDFKMGSIESTYPDGKEFTAADIQKIRFQHMAGMFNYPVPAEQQIRFNTVPVLPGSYLWYGISNVCMDKHSIEGKNLGRSIQHFLEVKAFLRNEDPSLVALNDYYLRLCLLTRYNGNGFNGGGSNDGGFFDRSGLSPEEYANWIPELRKRFDEMNIMENMILQKTITITFSECVENHVGNQMVGQKAATGFTCEELITIGNNFKTIGVVTEYHDLNKLLEGTGVIGEQAGILILRNAASRFINLNANESAANAYLTPDKLFTMLAALDWDSRCLMKGKVVNKHARHNLCFGSVSQEPTYEEGKGRIYNWDQVPMLKSMKEKFGSCFGEKAKDLLAEGNFYYDKTCYIGAHGDSERQIVVALRLGASMNLHFQWYQETNCVGVMATYVLHHSDMYIFSSKAVGTDWKKRKVATLRHSANYPK